MAKEIAFEKFTVFVDAFDGDPVGTYHMMAPDMEQAKRGAVKIHGQKIGHVQIEVLAVYGDHLAVPA